MRKKQEIFLLFFFILLLKPFDSVCAFFFFPSFLTITQRQFEHTHTHTHIWTQTHHARSCFGRHQSRLTLPSNIKQTHLDRFCAGGGQPFWNPFWNPFWLVWVRSILYICGDITKAISSTSNRGKKNFSAPQQTFPTVVVSLSFFCCCVCCCCFLLASVWCCVFDFWDWWWG